MNSLKATVRGVDFQDFEEMIQIPSRLALGPVMFVYPMAIPDRSLTHGVQVFCPPICSGSLTMCLWIDGEGRLKGIGKGTTRFFLQSSWISLHTFQRLKALFVHVCSR